MSDATGGVHDVLDLFERCATGTEDKAHDLVCLEFHRVTPVDRYRPCGVPEEVVRHLARNDKHRGPPGVSLAYQCSQEPRVVQDEQFGIAHLDGGCRSRD